MNFLFSLAQGLTSSFVILIMYYVIPKTVRKDVPLLKHVAIFTGVALAASITTNSMMAYGPKVELPAAQIPGAPTSQVVEKNVFIRPSNRVGQFDERLDKD